ncbi:Zona pellucida sperm-binding protein 4 [Liparis tanakae]|uniref:Zona pellucida sperm-binding protein 4 n=1 Tax=Liparis tanakae TaxID=230148 RepID=A0A4Z2H0D5_9TELE|nr:Zona pellucida sperm-binding protein 4 [Liparis tanakae]
MISHCANRFLVTLCVAVLAQRSRCLSPVPREKTPAQLVMPDVTCYDRRMRAVFGPRVNSNIHVQDRTGALTPALQSNGFCGLKLGRDLNQNLSFFSTYDGCYAQMKGGNVFVPLQVQLLGGNQWLRVKISCPLTQRQRERIQHLPTRRLPTLPGSCAPEGPLQLDCGQRGISRDACHQLGCCYDARKLTCHYKLNACSLDGHVVFSVDSALADRRLDPSGLVVNGLSQCTPAATTPDAAVFKIGLTDCGAKMKAMLLAKEF